MRVERDVMITASVIATLVLVAALALWMPTTRERTRLLADIQAAQVVLQQNVKIDAELAEHRSFVSDLKDELNMEHRRVPHGVNLGDLLRRVSTEVRAQSVTEQETQTLPIVHGEHYSAIPVVLKFNGSFPAAYGMVESIETMPRLVRVTGLNIDGDPLRPNEPLRVRIEMAAIFTREEASK
jgi:Tfp pilus assembly protein PilO